MKSIRILFLLTASIAIVEGRSQALDSLDIKIGQMILIGFPGPAVDTKVLEEIRQGKVGSIIIFEKNIPQVFVTYLLCYPVDFFQLQSH